VKHGDINYVTWSRVSLELNSIKQINIIWKVYSHKSYKLNFMIQEKDKIILTIEGAGEIQVLPLF